MSRGEDYAPYIADQHRAAYNAMNEKCCLCVFKWVCPPIEQSTVHLEDTADKGGDSLTLRRTLYPNITHMQTYTHSHSYVRLWPEAVKSFSFLITSEWQKGCYFVADAPNRLIRKHKECSTSGSSPVSHLWWEEQVNFSIHRLWVPVRIGSTWVWTKTAAAETKQTKNFHS